MSRFRSSKIGNGRFTHNLQQRIKGQGEVNRACEEGPLRSHPTFPIQLPGSLSVHHGQLDRACSQSVTSSMMISK
jgi:hypothetical protein